MAVATPKAVGARPKTTSSTTRYSVRLYCKTCKGCGDSEGPYKGRCCYCRRQRDRDYILVEKTEEEIDVIKNKRIEKDKARAKVYAERADLAEIKADIEYVKAHDAAIYKKEASKVAKIFIRLKLVGKTPYDMTEEEQTCYIDELIKEKEIDPTKEKDGIIERELKQLMYEHCRRELLPTEEYEHNFHDTNKCYGHQTSECYNCHKPIDEITECCTKCLKQYNKPRKYCPGDFCLIKRDKRWFALDSFGRPDDDDTDDEVEIDDNYPSLPESDDDDYYFDLATMTKVDAKTTTRDAPTKQHQGDRSHR